MLDGAAGLVFVVGLRKLSIAHAESSILDLRLLVGPVSHNAVVVAWRRSLETEALSYWLRQRNELQHSNCPVLVVWIKRRRPANPVTNSKSPTTHHRQQFDSRRLYRVGESEWCYDISHGIEAAV